MTLSELKKINFRQPKYILPAIIYLPFLATAYFVIDAFGTKVEAKDDKSLQTTEFLNPNLPGAQIKNGDGIGGKYENMTKSYGNISDYSAVDNIDRENKEEEREDYESQYTEDDIAAIEQQIREDEAARAAEAEEREAQVRADLDRALAEARLTGQTATGAIPADSDTIVRSVPSHEEICIKKGDVSENGDVRKALSDEAKPQDVVKKVKVTSDYFNTLAQNEHEPRLIKAIIDEDIKAVDGSRVRLRLLDDIAINETVIPKGSYLYATMSGFSTERVKGDISSVLVDDELIKVSLSIYDTDSMEGLFVPGSQFRETTKEVAGGTVSGTMSMNTTGSNSLTQWGLQAAQNAYQKTSNAISKAIKKNKVKLKYGTFVYLVNGREQGK
ncbi:MAG: conjugative transposon protein TraM [Prevotella sp.]|nr:conjugative transposon protein TraM [Prevotella sp.]